MILSINFADEIYLFVYSSKGLAVLFVVGWICIALLWMQANRNDKREKEDNIKHWKQVGVNKPRRDFHG